MSKTLERGENNTKEIHIGDKVIMNDRYHVSDKNKGVVWVVRSEPFDVCGSVCVMLEGYRGGYAVDGLDVVKEATP